MRWVFEEIFRRRRRLLCRCGGITAGGDAGAAWPGPTASGWTSMPIYRPVGGRDRRALAGGGWRRAATGNSASGARRTFELLDRPFIRAARPTPMSLAGALPAGWPQTREGVLAQRPARQVAVRRGRFPEGAFGLEVRGDSMNAAQPEPIFDRDIVVLVSPEQRSPQPEDIVAALIDGETCLKRLKTRKRSAFLKSESTNPAHGEIHPTHDLVIQGVFVGKL